MPIYSPRQVTADIPEAPYILSTDFRFSNSLVMHSLSDIYSLAPQEPTVDLGCLLTRDNINTLRLFYQLEPSLPESKNTLLYRKHKYEIQGICDASTNAIFYSDTYNLSVLCTYIRKLSLSSLRYLPTV